MLPMFVQKDDHRLLRAFHRHHSSLFIWVLSTNASSKTVVFCFIKVSCVECCVLPFLFFPFLVFLVLVQA